MGFQNSKRLVIAQGMNKVGRWMRYTNWRRHAALFANKGSCWRIQHTTANPAQLPSAYAGGCKQKRWHIVIKTAPKTGTDNNTLARRRAASWGAPELNKAYCSEAQRNVAKWSQTRMVVVLLHKHAVPAREWEPVGMPGGDVGVLQTQLGFTLVIDVTC